MKTKVTTYQLFGQLRMDLARTWARGAYDLDYRDKLDGNRVLRAKAKDLSDALNEEIANDNMEQEMKEAA